MPHVPLFVGEQFKGKSKAGLYGDVIQEIDWSVGEIVKALDAHKLADNTLVIFTTDNGPWLSYGNHGGTANGLREGKGTVWEGGVRVPFIARWPGKIPADAAWCRTRWLGSEPGIGVAGREVTACYPASFVDANTLLPRIDRGRLVHRRRWVSLRHYEVMVILNPDLEERTVGPALDQFLKVVKDSGGSVEKVDIWGRRRLSFEMQKRWEGIYAVIDLTAEPAAVLELNRQMNLNEAVMRTKVMRPDMR
jgi:ribosomal protein S6